MAHAVSGSAYSAKGGNLKFADVVRERFRGPAFGQDFTTWLDEVLLGFETANISESSQVTHLVAFLESPNREIAVAYLKKWKEENPQPEPAARAADRESAMRDHHRAQWQALVAMPWDFSNLKLKDLTSLEFGPNVEFVTSCA